VILGIDASNIVTGGGITHLCEVLKCSGQHIDGFRRIIVWTGSKTIAKVCYRAALKKMFVPVLLSRRSLPGRVLWQQIALPKLVKQHGCNLLFSPGGSLPCRLSVPAVTMSQNMLPFEGKEAERYKTASMRIRLKLLNTVQRMSYQKADGLIFLTQYAKSRISLQLKKRPARSTIIPHGISKRFFLPPREQNPLDLYSQVRPFRLLYISNVDVYKHQWYVAEAVVALRKKGFPVIIDFIGSSYPEAMRRFKKAVQRVDLKGDVVTYKGFCSYDEIAGIYHRADAFVFASSCENMPNILLEAMASGLPIACSGRGPMPEMLGSGGLYFDPESPNEIEKALRTLVESIELRGRCASTAYRLAKKYSWERCASETFSFLSQVAQHKYQNTDCVE
jgi:glycosyltransferase involved in cell wall biosynthesis